MDKSRRRTIMMNLNLGLILAWLARVVQRLSRKSLRTKKMETNERHMVLLLVLIDIVREERSGGVCRRAAFGSRRRSERLRAFWRE
jgi:hypothetical protein